MEGRTEGLLQCRRDSSYPKGPGDAIKVYRTAEDLKEKEKHDSVMEDVNADVFETESYVNDSLSKGSEKMNMIAEVIFFYLWWSVFQIQTSVVWFYPLCLMEISGYEVLGFVWMSPVLMKFECVREFVTRPYGLMMVRMLTMVGVASFLSSTTIVRVIVGSTGNFFAVLALAGTLWDKHKIDRYRHIYLFMMGYLLYLAIRVWGTSFNYIFMKNSLNVVAILVGMVTSLIMYANDVRSPLITSQPPPSSPEKKEEEKEEMERKNQPASPRIPGLVATAVAFGSLTFVTSFLFAEVSVLTRWAVAPHPFPGPQPHPWGMATLLALAMGLVFFANQVDLLTSVPWLSVGLIFFAVLYYGETYTAFFGGLVLAIYTTSLWPLLLKRIVAFPPHKLFAIAMGTFFFYMVLSVWVVAYNFVPGGVYTRERTDIMMIMAILGCGMGTCSFSLNHVENKASENLLEKRDHVLMVNFFGRVFRRLSTIAEDPENEMLEETVLVQQALNKEQVLSEGKELGIFHRRFLKGTLWILLFAVVGFVWRCQGPYPMPSKERPRVFSAGIWAFHFGYDNMGWPSMERAAQFIEDTEVDVIGLLETDASRPYIGSHDIASWLGERLHMHVDYGPGSKDHTWGTMLLSKYPIVWSQHYMLPSPEGEIAPAIMATINISGELVDFYAVHFGNDRDDLDRKLQAQTTAEILSNSTNPSVVLSYVTSRPGSRDYNTITKIVKDIDPSDRKRFCEYIFYSNLTRVGYARISHGGLSDTEMQVGKFMIRTPPFLEDWKYVTTDPGEVPSWMLFPSKFGEHWIGHYWSESENHFHMDTPKYFKIHG